jgi:hypothetical protein
MVYLAQDLRALEGDLQRWKQYIRIHLLASNADEGDAPADGRRRAASLYCVLHISIEQNKDQLFVTPFVRPPYWCNSIASFCTFESPSASSSNASPPFPPVPLIRTDLLQIAFLIKRAKNDGWINGVIYLLTWWKMVCRSCNMQMTQIIFIDYDVHQAKMRSSCFASSNNCQV